MLTHCWCGKQSVQRDIFGKGHNGHKGMENDGAKHRADENEQEIEAGKADDS